MTPRLIRKYFPACESCPVGNLAQAPAPQESTTIVSAPGDVVELDFKGPFYDDRGRQIVTFGGKKIVAQAVDVYSGYGHAFLEVSTRRPEIVVRKLINAYRARRKRITVLRVDAAFDTAAVRELCAHPNNSITLQVAAPNEHFQIGHVERLNRTLISMYRKEVANKPHITNEYFGMAYLDCLDKYNLMPRSINDDCCPAELFGLPPHDYKNTPLFPFGTVVMAHNPVHLQGSTGPRAFETSYVGSIPGTKGGLKLYNPATKRIICRRTFKVIGPIRPRTITASGDIYLAAYGHADDIPDDFPSVYDAVIPSASDASPLPSDPLVDVAGPVSSSVASIIPLPAQSPPALPLPSSLLSRVHSAMDTHAPSVDATTPSTNTIAHTPDIPVKTTLHRRNRSSTRVSNRPPPQPASPSENPYARIYTSRRSSAQVDKYSIPVPKCVRQARLSVEADSWLEAIRAEINSLIASGTLKPVDLSTLSKDDLANLLRTKFVFAKKYDPDGTFNKFKARLVGRGDLLKEIYGETFAGTATTQSIFMFLSIAAELDLELEAIDISSAFLHPVYVGPRMIVKRPPGLTDADMPEYMELGKCIYGLPQAARAFRAHLDKSLRNIGFVPTRADPCVYILRRSDGQFVIACTHVDDIGLAASSTDLLTDIKSQLSDIYKITTVPDMTHYLGMNIIRDRPTKTIYVNQSGYVVDLEEEFGISSKHPPMTPLPVPSSATISHDDLSLPTVDIPPVDNDVLLSTNDASSYRSRVGALLFLATRTRPDIFHSVTECSRHNTNPSARHLSHVNRILRYVVSTKDLGLCFHSGEGIVLYATADASYAVHSDRKSHSGYTLHIGRNSGSLYSFSKKQPVVALSSTEAEFVASAEAAKMIVWARLLLHDLGFPQQSPTILYQDNQSTIKLLTDDSYRARSKHIDVRFHFIRELVNERILEPVYLPTEDMTADILTKTLGPRLFLRLRPRLLGAVNLPPSERTSASFVWRFPLPPCVIAA